MCKIIIFIETDIELRLPGARKTGEGKNYRVMGIEFLFGMIKKFWN